MEEERGGSGKEMQEAMGMGGKWGREQYELKCAKFKGGQPQDALP